jgi:hypothetical protein
MIFKKYAPCLILIDEWVAYLRQITLARLPQKQQIKMVACPPDGVYKLVRSYSAQLRVIARQAFRIIAFAKRDRSRTA